MRLTKLYGVDSYHKTFIVFLAFFESERTTLVCKLIEKQGFLHSCNTQLVSHDLCSSSCLVFIHGVIKAEGMDFPIVDLLD